MTPDMRIKRVVFAEKELRKAYEDLKNGKYEEKELADRIDRAIALLKLYPFRNIKLPQELWPEQYTRKYGIRNLYKCNLSGGWRLIYTVESSKIEIVSILLEWLDHTEYNRRFGYRSR